MIFRSQSLATVLLLLGVAACRTAASVPSVVEPPSNATAAVPSDLRDIYSGETWQWPSGAAYFSPTGEFRAWLDTDNNPSYATGAWWATDAGELCYSASWRSKARPLDHHTTCFAHLKHGEVWYQRKEPSGDWYIFRSHPIEATDEIARFRTGDLIEAQFQKIRGRVGEPAS